jgi:deoxyribonuclease-1
VFGLVMVLASITTARADQTKIPGYDQTRPIFWDQLYPDGGFTLYCAQPFTRRIGLHVEHVYPASWMVDHIGCSSRKACRANSPRFNLMEADLHNLYPARAGTNGARSNMIFGEVPGEAREFGNTCDFEIDTVKKIAEPPPEARGNVARSIFYMHQEYGLPIDQALLLILKAWNLEDPPDSEEWRRNDAVDGLQGTRNTFVDQPGLGDQL